jgi:rhamnulokinase
MTVCVAADLGAESGRVVAGTFDGERLALEEVHRFPNVPVRLGGQLVWDLPALLRGVGEGLGAARDRGVPVDSVGVDSWGVDFVLLDRLGRPVGNPVHYRDARTGGMVEELRRRLPPAELYDRTGIQFIPLNSLVQLLAMADGGDPQLEAARTFLTIADYVHHWLGAEPASERTIASTTQCLCWRDGRWALDVLDRLGIPSAMFPAVLEPGTVAGSLSDAARDVSRLGDVPVVLPAAHDTASAVAGLPAPPDERAAYISSGTWSLVGVEVPEPVVTPDARAANLTNEAGAGGTRLLRNLTGLWLLHQCLQEWRRQGLRLAYEDLGALALEASPFAAVIDTQDERFTPPGDVPGRVAALCRETGQDPPPTPAATVRILLEGLALAYRRILGTIEDVVGWRPERVHVVGGGARNELLCQWTADATGLPVCAGPAEATATGNVLVQLLGLGRLGSLAEGRELVRRSLAVEIRTYEPRPDERWEAAANRLQAGPGPTKGGGNQSVLRG